MWDWFRIGWIFRSGGFQRYWSQQCQSFCKITDRLIRNRSIIYLICYLVSGQADNWQTGVFDRADYESSITKTLNSKFNSWVNHDRSIDQKSINKLLILSIVDRSSWKLTDRATNLALYLDYMFDRPINTDRLLINYRFLWDWFKIGWNLRSRGFNDCRIDLKRSDLVPAERDTLCMHMYHLIIDCALGCCSGRFREALVIELSGVKLGLSYSPPVTTVAESGLMLVAAKEWSMSNVYVTAAFHCLLIPTILTTLFSVL